MAAERDEEYSERGSSEGRGSSSSQRRRRPPRRDDRRRRGAATQCGPRCIGYKSNPISYKQVDVLRRYVTDRGKIRPRRQTGTCAKHQRVLAQEIKRARHMALLPFTAGQTYSSDEER